MEGEMGKVRVDSLVTRTKCPVESLGGGECFLWNDRVFCIPAGSVGAAALRNTSSGREIVVWDVAKSRLDSFATGALVIPVTLTVTCTVD